VLSKQMQKTYLLSLAFVCGAAVLALEIVGTRVLGPYFGATIYLWSALITVTLLALSIGYMVGGRVADRHPTLSLLSWLIFSSGILVLLIPWIRHPVILLTSELGLRAAVLASAMLLFFIPLTLLGMVSPLLIKIKAKHLSELGAAVGGLYAVSTLGSVVTALLTGYVLIPYIGVNLLMLVIGLLLILAAAPGLVSERSAKSKTTISVLLIFFVIAAVVVTPVEAAAPDKGLLEVRQSAYSELRVIEKSQGDARIRYLLMDGAAHSVVDPTSWNSYTYYNFMMDMLRGFHEPGDLLLIGLGGGSYAKSSTRNGWKVDALEIDPAVIDLAKEYFGLQPEDAQVFCVDGRRYLVDTEKQYDVIAMDAFGSSLIPFHLMTVEFFELVKRRLKPNGIFLINVVVLVKDDPLVGPLTATLKSQFRHVWGVPMFHQASRTTNIVFFVSDTEYRSPVDEIVATRYDGVILKSSTVFDQRIVPHSDPSQILTDDRSTADIVSEKINLAMRRELHSRLQGEELSW
jgi:predicted membrane-bound spermidine synthase